jgi:integrase
MPIHIFTAAEVASRVKAGAPGLWGDGAGLFLQIPKNSPRAYWLFMWTRQNRRRALSLGPARLVPLAKARKAAAECLDLVREGRDPMAERGRVRTKATQWNAVVEEYFVHHEARRREWAPMIARYCGPIASMPVAAITRQDIGDLLRPIWTTKNSTATRLATKLFHVCKFAAGRGYRTGNPAEWEGHLEYDLPRVGRAIVPMRSMPHAKVPALVANLVARSTELPCGDPAAEALLFTILTTCRMGDTCGKDDAPSLRWSDIDLGEQAWNVPKIKTEKKSGRTFPVPLASQIVDLLLRVKARQAQGTEHVFSSEYFEGKPVSEKSVRAVQKALAPGFDIHGYRASFKTYASDALSADREVIETALMHHVPGTDSERAYMRGSYFEKRRRLMQAWADHCFGTTNGNVLRFAA